MDMKQKFFTFLIFLISISVNAQTTEPKNNIGKTLTQMKSLFPQLRYIKTDEKGDKYEDGYPQDGIATFFYFKNSKVVEECMIVQAKDDFPRMWYKTMVDEFRKYPYGFGTEDVNEKHWVYSTFTLNIILMSENGTNTALVIYENGGYNTGVTGATFFKQYKK
ncbi:MAG: hypothetical protein IJP75_03505 [Bacteroidaceae bacterium]|nr:hypothetical protein [Bacteroidaceae bacterium]